MTDEDKLKKELARGRMARDVLDNEVFAESFVSIRNRIFEEWAQSPIHDDETRHSLYLMSRLLDKLHEHLRAVMETGKVAEFNLKSSK